MSSVAAEVRAAELLKQLGVGGPPVPVDHIAAATGAHLTYETLDGEVSGLLYRDEERKVIGVNSRHAPVRQRFTIAHEIGHLLMHEGRPVFIDRLVRVNARDGSTSQEEVEANAFAAELLMPRILLQGEVNSILGQGRSVGPDELVRELATKFQVSSEAMGYRLANLGVLDPDSGF